MSSNALNSGAKIRREIIGCITNFGDAGITNFGDMDITNIGDAGRKNGRPLTRSSHKM